MSRVKDTAPLSRCLAVWVAVSLLASTALRLVVPGVLDSSITRPGELAALPFDAALAGLAGALLSLCIAWWWAVTSLAVLEAATTVRVPGCPRLVRRAVLLACGLSLACGLNPAVADQSANQSAGLPPGTQSIERAALSGLQLPDRSPQPMPAPPSVPRQGPATAVVAAGDTLWDIAAERLHAGASAAEIDAAWRRIWRANRTVVGADPDLIHPGTELHLPTTVGPADPTEEK